MNEEVIDLLDKITNHVDGGKDVDTRCLGCTSCNDGFCDVLGWAQQAKKLIESEVG